MALCDNKVGQYNPECAIGRNVNQDLYLGSIDSDPQQPGQLLQAIYQLTRAISALSTPDDVYQAVCNHLGQLGYDAFILRLDVASTQLVLEHAPQYPGSNYSATEVFPFSLQGLDLAVEAEEVVVSSLLGINTAQRCRLQARQLIDRLPAIMQQHKDEVATWWSSQQCIVTPVVRSGKTKTFLAVVAPELKDSNLPAICALGCHASLVLEYAHLRGLVGEDHQQARKLTKQIVVAQEKERKRLSRELHDEAGQALTALKLSLEMIRADISSQQPLLHQRVSEAVDLANTTMDHIRLLAQNLRPPALDAIGLDPTLEGFCQDFAIHTGLAVHYLSDELPELSEETSICLYRILQEALTNVAKHAHASQISVSIRTEGAYVVLCVVDDGRGFQTAYPLAADVPPSGIGLLGMRERVELVGGYIHIDSVPDKGVALSAYVPWRTVV